MNETLSAMPLLAPFIEFGFMRRALAGCLAPSLGATPVGVFLMLRRMSLAGDAMSHAILPGAAVGYLIAGLSLPAMTIGGLVAGLAVAVLSGGVARNSVIKEDASLATFYLISLSAGVLIISLGGSSVDLLHVLFGSVLALDDATLLLLAGFASVSVVALSLGPLMAVGIMILPAAAARLWVCNIGPLLLIAVLIAIFGSFVGLLLSYYADLPAGPAIVLTLGALYLLSLAVGPLGPLASRWRSGWHFER